MIGGDCSTMLLTFFVTEPELFFVNMVNVFLSRSVTTTSAKYSTNGMTFVSLIFLTVAHTNTCLVFGLILIWWMALIKTDNFVCCASRESGGRMTFVLGLSVLRACVKSNCVAVGRRNDVNCSGSLLMVDLSFTRPSSILSLTGSRLVWSEMFG